MELIDFRIQLEGVGEQEIKKSTVHLVVNQEGNEEISIYYGYVVLHNCSIRNIVSESDVWHHYFKIHKGDGQDTVIVESKIQHSFKLTKVKD